jgi:uridine kinase
MIASKRMTGLDEVTKQIVRRRTTTPDTRCLLVGVSGIDGCGKGYVSRQLEARLALHGVVPAVVNVDGWLNLPEKRFDRSCPAENFYANAIRFDQFFTQLVIPLRERRSVHLVADLTEETASQYRKHTYDFKDVSVVLVEGIFLFKREYRTYFDVAIWIDCSFSTALARAINRAQEGLSAAQTIAAYETIYFPAQQLHLTQDHPRENADLVFENDSGSGTVRTFSSRASAQFSSRLR